MSPIEIIDQVVSKTVIVKFPQNNCKFCRSFNDKAVNESIGYRVETRGNRSVLLVDVPEEGIYKVRAINNGGVATSYGYTTVLGECNLGKCIYC